MFSEMETHMAEPHVVSALIKKRAEITGSIAALERQIRDKQHALAHVDATLKIFAPEMKLTEIKVRQPPHARSPYFVNGEISDRCHEAMRSGKSVTAQEIAIEAMRDKGLDPEDRKLRSDFVKRIHWALGRMQANGTIERRGKNANVRWLLPKDGAE